MFVSIWDAIIAKSDKDILAIWHLVQEKNKKCNGMKIRDFLYVGGYSQYMYSLPDLCTQILSVFWPRLCLLPAVAMTRNDKRWVLYSKLAVFVVKVRQFQIFEYQLFDPYRLFFAYSYSVHKKNHLPRRQTEKRGSSMCIQIIKYETNCISTDN